MFTDHNRLAQAQFSTVAENPEQNMDESARFDPVQYADRFGLGLERESRPSYERIHKIMGIWPQSVWSVTDDAERYGV